MRISCRHGWMMLLTLTALAAQGQLTNFDLGVGISSSGGVVQTNAQLTNVTFNVNYPSVVTVSNGVYLVQASGAGGTNGPQDGMNYIYQPQSGDFDMAVRVEKITGSDARARAGLVMRESQIGRAHV